MNANQYYNKIAEKFNAALNYSKDNSYSTRCGIAQGSNEHSYIIKHGRFDTLKTQKENSLIQKVFLNDFKEHLINDKPFNFEYPQAEYILANFFGKLTNYLFQINDISHYSQPSNYVIPTTEEFEKVMKCIEPTLPSIEVIIRGIPKNCQYDIYPYIPILMSIHNENFYYGKNNDELQTIIKNEINTLWHYFSGDTNPLIAKSIKNYLNKKEPLLVKIQDSDFENYLYELIQSIVHSDFWPEIASCIPSFKNKKRSITDKNIFDSSQNPISYIHLNKNTLFNMSPSILTEKDLSRMLSEITSAVDETRPSNIDFIQLVNIRDSSALVISSKTIDDEMSSKIKNVFENMVYEFNSDKIKKVGNAGDIDDIMKNQEYLVKVARVFWLELELTESDTHPKRIHKI